ncbi:DUF2147 domain-containing protein [Sphingomonas sp.]|uniref:DUF2147 domain-containing protein n=1 Tax=Sphingomonas sp. TaxID=28214 RepID=UPI000DB5C88A|nr:DUF2147 domain-containing protein [Sphingomonas sp.]PZU08723.1 MAG: DUF2147 domain-containing protein [Sphingomonas sp.]
MIVLMAAAALAAGGAESIVGKWRAETKGAVIEIARCGSSICGKLTGSDGLRANPDMLDAKNKEPKLRGRRVMGLEMISGAFTFADGSWSGGTVYNPDDGGTYKATLTLPDNDHLKLKGCIVWPLCKTQTWTRIR